jgi:hypothetical protein
MVWLSDGVELLRELPWPALPMGLLVTPRECRGVMSEKDQRSRVSASSVPRSSTPVGVSRAVNGITKLRTGPTHVDRHASIDGSKKRTLVP